MSIYNSSHEKDEFCTILNGNQLAIIISREIPRGKQQRFYIDLVGDESAKKDFEDLKADMFDLLKPDTIFEYWKRKKIEDDGKIVLVGNSYEDIRKSLILMREAKDEV